MADLKQLPEEALRAVAVQVGDRIAEEFESAAGAVPPAPVAGVAQPADFSPLAGVDRAAARFRLAETFEVWTLRDGVGGELAGTQEDLAALARDTGTCRHQVRLVRGDAERAVAFAQSHAGAANPDERVVSDFYFSPLAAQVDAAVELADQLIPEAAAVRLLSLPEFKVEALWFVTPSNTTRGVVVASAPDDFPGQRMSLMDSADFVRALARTTRGMGLLF
jgi:hypothetical protein